MGAGNCHSSSAARCQRARAEDIDATRRFWQALADVCLASLAGAPVAPQHDVRRAVAQCAGAEQLFMLERLTRLGLLRLEGGAARSRPLAAAEKLAPWHEARSADVSDPAYVLNGFCPPVAAVHALLLDALGTGERAAGRAALDRLVGRLDAAFGGGTATLLVDEEALAQPQGRSTVVCGLGGLTCAEVSALRAVAQSRAPGAALTVLTTSLLTPQTFLAQFASERREAADD